MRCLLPLTTLLIACGTAAVPTAAAVDLVPLYAYWDTGLGAPFYTTNFAEAGDGSATFVYTGVACYVAPEADAAAGLLPLYRYYSPFYGHFYTADWNELGAGAYTYSYEGIQCYVAPYQGHSSADPTGQGDPVEPVFRFYDTGSGAHRFILGWSSFYNYWVYNNPSPWTYEEPVFDVWMTPYPLGAAG